MSKVSIDRLRHYCMDNMQKYPKLKEEIEGMYVWAISEIEDGEPAEHEVELAIEAIDQLIKDRNGSN